MSWSDEISRLDEAITVLQGLDTDGLGDQELSDLLEELHRQANRLGFTTHDVTRRFETRGCLLTLGYRNLGQWHRDKLHMSPGRAGRITALSRSLTYMPTVAKLWSEGRMTADAAQAIARLRSDLTEEAFDRDESWLAERRRQLRSS